MRATLARRLGDLDLAEEALADAVERATQVWPQDGTPANPAGWLVTTAWHRALDVIRRERTGREKLALLAREPAPAGTEDDRLALVFTCCHPVLAEPLQIALTLNVVCGLTSEEISAAFLVPPATMAQRLVRAKHQLRRAGVRFAEPEPEDLPRRLRAVLAVVYAVFNEGYLGRTTERAELCREASDLAAQLYELMQQYRARPAGIASRSPRASGLAVDGR